MDFQILSTRYNTQKNVTINFKNHLKYLLKRGIIYIAYYMIHE